ncbi:MAG: trimeric intracellular cation channel family protein [Acidobacteriota bacterium]
MLVVLDLLGTFVFAMSGGFEAVRHRLDWLGVAVLAVLTGVGGGLVRDVLLGDLPPASLRDERYLVACLLGAAVAVAAAPRLARGWNRVMLADAAGLGLFAALGAAKGLAHGLGPLGVILAGSLTAVGGGVIRDVLVGKLPAVLHKDFYATAAILGCGVLLALHRLGATPAIQLVAAAATTSILRLVAMERRAQLPRAGLRDGGPSAD